ncbi:MAG: hypothetical protein KAY22_23010 [Rhizorhabdus sp.]|nr:hypothetical protein [Rhizorhabdus sp.]
MAVLGMLLVNLPGDAQVTFPLLAHAPWHGLTLADLVFPAFLVAVGLAVARAGRPAIDAVLRRTLGLLVIGIALGVALNPSLAFDELRWPGVLQRIGIVYLVCALVARASVGPLMPLGLAACLLVAHTLLILMIAAPGEALPSLAPGEGVSGWLDRQLLPGRLHRQTYDPEGFLSTFPAIASGLLGVSAGRGAETLARQTAMAISCIALGLAMSVVLPLNKTLWTASFALVTTGIALLVWLSLIAGSRGAFFRGLLDLLASIGQTALTIYVMHMLLIAVMIRTWNGETTWDRLFALFAVLSPAPAINSLAFAISLTLGCAAIALLLLRRNVRLRL